MLSEAAVGAFVVRFGFGLAALVVAILAARHASRARARIDDATEVPVKVKAQVETNKLNMATLETALQKRIDVLTSSLESQVESLRAMVKSEQARRAAKKSAQARQAKAAAGGNGGGHYAAPLDVSTVDTPTLQALAAERLLAKRRGE